jgi:hypothetical protein
MFLLEESMFVNPQNKEPMLANKHNSEAGNLYILRQ